MSSTATASRSPVSSWRRRRPPTTEGSLTTSAGTPIPPLSPRLNLLRAVLLSAFVVSVSLLLQLVLVSRVQQSAAQQRAFDDFRSDLAQGTAPIGPTDNENRELPAGTPVAYLEIPALGLSEVVVEGTSSSELFVGPGHRRDTPLPGQVGTSVLLGRRAAYGGPFSGIASLEEGDVIRVATGQGEFEFSVRGVRRENDPLPPPLQPGAARLTLATADGRPFLPDGVVRVDADLVGEAVGGPARLHSSDTLPGRDRLLAGDTRTLWALALWLQLLIGLSVAAIWSWHRWGRALTWVVFVPPLLLAGLAAAGEVARLLPNLT